jgi:hypothetical protein
LLQYVDSVVVELAKLGSLEGIVLTGLNSTGADIFEQYINIVGDVQTPALAFSTPLSKKLKDSRVESWVKL